MEDNVLIHSYDYLAKTVPNFQSIKSGGVVTFTCPACNTEPPSCAFVPKSPSFRMRCSSISNCKAENKAFDLASFLMFQKSISRDEAYALIINELNLNVTLPELMKSMLDLYEMYSFDMVPVSRHNKAPVEMDWVNKTHTSKQEWEKWILDNGLNIGVKTGERSNVTVVDVDTSIIPKEIDAIKGDPLIQKTRQGWHLFYQYEADLATSRIEEMKIDILNNGKQCILYPSVIDDYRREFINDATIPKMPTELKEFLKEKAGKRPIPKTESEVLLEDINTEGFQMDAINQGSRNSMMIRLGGILRKGLNLPSTAYVLNIMNKHFCKPSLDNKEFRALIDQLDKYVTNDLQDVTSKVLTYLKLVEEANSRDVQEVIGEKKEIIEKVLAYLLKEGLVTRRRRLFYPIKKAEWSLKFPAIDNEIPFKVPYFNDIAHFNYGDMILLAGQSKTGKTTISMNMIKQFVDQGIQPHYICLESGSRFIKTALRLGMKEGDFKHAFVTDPTQIELEHGAVTIIDWLLIADKSQSDSVLKHFVEQLYKTQGLLIIFMQLKVNNDWFAPNMILQFPALSARYIYDKDSPNPGTFGAWQVDAVRDPKNNTKTGNIPCVYDWESRELKIMGEDYGNQMGEIGRS